MVRVAIRSKYTGVFSECGRCLALVIIWNAGGYKSVGFRYNHRILYANCLTVQFV